jgi:hypothetical protein
MHLFHQIVIEMQQKRPYKETLDRGLTLQSTFFVSLLGFGIALRVYRTVNVYIVGCSGPVTVSISNLVS